jgi:predicted RNase H-like HicB family nuclease
MSNKLKSSRKKADRPFDPEIISKATAVANRYQMVIWFEDGEYYGRGVELPTVFADGPTPDECVTNTREAFVTVVATLLEHGEIPPAPASEEKRDRQVNIRLTSQERLVLETRARQNGAAGISDYIRTVALASKS